LDTKFNFVQFALITTTFLAPHRSVFHKMSHNAPSHRRCLQRLRRQQPLARADPRCHLRRLKDRRQRYQRVPAECEQIISERESECQSPHPCNWKGTCAQSLSATLTLTGFGRWPLRERRAVV